MRLDDEDDKTTQNEETTEAKEEEQTETSGEDGEGTSDEAAKAKEGEGAEGEGEEDSDEEARKAEAKGKNPIPEWMQRRINKAVRAQHEAERKAAALEEKLKGKAEEAEDDTDKSPDVINELADRLAEQKVAVKQFNDACDAAFDSGVEKYGEQFKGDLNTLRALDMMQPELVQEMLATDSPADVMHKLASDPEKAQRILEMPPAKRIAEFVKMAIPESKPGKQVSKAGAPITPIKGAPKKDFDLNDPEADDAEWFRRRNEDAKKKGFVY